MKPTSPRRSAGVPLRLGAVCAFAGVAIGLVAELLHGGTDPADLRAILPEYASNDLWQAVHVGQFLGIASIVASLLVLTQLLDLAGVRWLGATAITLGSGWLVAGIAVAYRGFELHVWTAYLGYATAAWVLWLGAFLWSRAGREARVG